MATASITKMIVPAADNSTPSQGLLMPKLQYRFRVTFTNFGINSATGPITQQVMVFSRIIMMLSDLIIKHMILVH